MNQLTKIEILKLTPAAQNFVVLRQGHRQVRDMQPNALKRALTDVLTRASFDAGNEMAKDQKILNFQTEGFFAEIKGKLLDLTLPEIGEAVNRGVRGEAGPWFGFCPKTYHQWLKWFHELPERQKAWVDYLALEPPPAPKIDKVLFSKQAILHAFDRYKESGEMPLTSAAYYSILNDFIGVEYKGVKTLVTDPQVRKRITAEVKERLTQGFLKVKDKEEKRGNLSGAEALMGAVAGEFKEGSTLSNEVKKAFLKHFFDELIRTNQPLKL